MPLIVYLAVVGILAIASYGAALNQKKDPILAWVIVFAVWIAFAGNDENPDYAGYLERYELVQRGDEFVGESAFEPGFHLLTVLSVELGLGYQAFVMVVATISLALIHRTLLRVPGAANFVYPLYIVYPFIYDVIQLRNSLALAVLIYGLGVLVAGRRWPRLTFAACLAVSVSFHFTAAFYAVILLIPWIQDRRIGGWPIFMGFAGTFLTLLNPSVTIVIKGALESIMGDGRYQNYLETRAELEILIPFVFQIWGLVLLSVALKALDEMSSDGSVPMPARSRRWATLAVNLCILSFAIFPLYVYGSNFWRIPRNVHIIYYLAFFLGQKALVGKKNQRLLFNVGVAGYSLGLLIFYSDSKLIGMILENNVILSHALGLDP